jgi:hypothetical protein
MLAVITGPNPRFDRRKKMSDLILPKHLQAVLQHGMLSTLMGLRYLYEFKSEMKFLPPEFTKILKKVCRMLLPAGMDFTTV